MMLVIRLIQACVVTVAITALRIASSIVVYTLASMIVATTLWTIVELLWYFLTASRNGKSHASPVDEMHGWRRTKL